MILQVWQGIPPRRRLHSSYKAMQPMQEPVKLRRFGAISSGQGLEGLEGLEVAGHHTALWYMLLCYIMFYYD